MLYEIWQRIAAERRGELALRDAVSDRRWTFGQLAAAGEGWPVAEGDWVFPRGQSPEFILTVLGGWRTGKVVCPVESVPVGAPMPPPPSCVHVKVTSATTGAARRVAFTAGQLQADAEQIVATMGLRPEWPNLGVISLAHSYGFSNLVLPLLLRGIPLILAPSPLPESVRRAAAEVPAIVLSAVPALWRAWHEAKAIPDNVRLAISAGAPLPARLEREVYEAEGIKVHNFYGATECGGIAYDATERPRTRESLAGTPLRGVGLSVNGEGCLVVRSPAVGETYWPEPAATLGAGRFQTSDLVELRDNRVFLRGRATDLINVAGRKVSPETIERALLAHPGVEECLVFGVPDFQERLGGRTEIVVAVVVGKVKESGLRGFLHKRLPGWQVPREWRFVESLARNARGKVSRTDWQRRYRHQAAGTGRRVVSSIGSRQGG
jgi:long-chain acyl-CoA synthetase